MSRETSALQSTVSSIAPEINARITKHLADASDCGDDLLEEAHQGEFLARQSYSCD